MKAAWAPFFGDSELRVFLTLVEAEVQARGTPYAMSDGVVELARDGGESESLGLENLAQVCAALPANEWPDAVTRHFDLVFERAEEETELEASLADFDQVRARLRVRLYGESLFEEQVARPVTDGLVAALVFDLPSSMRSVHRREALAWGRSDDELFATALENLDREEPPDRAEIAGPEAISLGVVDGPSCYTASHALRLAESAVPDDHPYGALVAIPARHVFFFHVIEDERVVEAVGALATLAREAFRVGPGSISEQVFWLRGGVWAHVPCSIEGGTLHMRPSAVFMRDVLERVVAPKS